MGVDSPADDAAVQDGPAQIVLTITADRNVPVTFQSISGESTSVDRQQRPRALLGIGLTTPVHTDQATLMATALAAIIATAIAPGKYGLLSTAFGIILLSVLAAYFRPEPAGGHLAAVAKSLAFGTTFSLCFSLAIGWPVQEFVDHRTIQSKCLQVATTGLPRNQLPSEFNPSQPDVAVEGLPPDRQAVYENCIGGDTSQKLAWGWLGTAIVLTIFARITFYRGPFPSKRAGRSQGAVGGLEGQGGLEARQEEQGQKQPKPAGVMSNTPSTDPASESGATQSATADANTGAQTDQSRGKGDETNATEPGHL